VRAQDDLLNRIPHTSAGAEVASRILDKYSSSKIAEEKGVEVDLRKQ
jgi:hypothetical protein